MASRAGVLAGALVQERLRLRTGPLVLRCGGPASSAQRAGICRAFQGWSGREDDGSAGVAAGCLSERLGGVGEAVAGGNRNLKLPVPELLREFAQLVSIGADV